MVPSTHITVKDAVRKNPWAEQASVYKSLAVTLVRSYGAFGAPTHAYYIDNNNNKKNYNNDNLYSVKWITAFTYNRYE